jgi:uroporphyrinogen-III synthase
MFVSAQAVRYFFDRQPAAMQANAQRVGDALQVSSSATWATGPRCWATGPGTHKALLQAGVPEVCIDSPAADAAQFDSEALWQRVSVQVQAGKPVLIVRGNDAHADAESSTSEASSTAQVGTGRDWLAQQLQAAGASAQFVVAYERRAPAWSTEQKAQAVQAATDGSVHLFFNEKKIPQCAFPIPGSPHPFRRRSPAPRPDR